jgi:hypothetical protein
MKSGRGKMSARIKLAALCLSALSISCAPAFSKETAQPAKTSECATVSRMQASTGHNRLVARILIHARPEIVWNTVHSERQKDPDIAYAKVLSQENNQLTLEEKFVLLPVIGTAKCIMKDIEVPNERIDYQLVESDHFKAMEGSWVLTSCDDGKSTILELSSYLELGFPVPRMVLDNITSQKLQKRVTNIKTLSERAEADRVAALKASST